MSQSYLAKLVDQSVPQTPLKRPGVMVSGGLDSGVLLYYLLKKYGTDLLIFTVPRYDDARTHAVRVAKTVCDNLNLAFIQPEFVGDPDEHHSEQVASGFEEVLEEDWADATFLGDTSNPVGTPVGDDPWAPTRYRSKDPKVLQPFFDLTKDQVVQAANDDGLSFIFEVSHSCTEQIVGRCHVCWQCRERAWAFEAAGLTDPGNC